MKSIYKYLSVIILSGLIFCGCYHNLQPVEINKETLSGTAIISTPTKCHVIDGSVILFDRGFNVYLDQIRGNGVRFYFKKEKKNADVTSFPLDSIVAITTYEDYNEARLIANGSLAIFGAAVVGITAYCVACPKCCFGSCPTVYTYDNGKASLETELFSSSISRMLENEDLDLLKQKIPDDGIYKLKITNEALETHYINKFNLILAEHPSGTSVYPDINGKLTLFRNPVSVKSAYNSAGEDVLNKISCEDTMIYRSGTELVNNLKYGPKSDWIDITADVPDGKCNAKLLVRYRNTLLSTILFYDVLLGSQGIKAVQWIDRMNNDREYAEDFKMIYDNFSGIQIEVFDDDRWVPAGRFPDAGPITFKNIAAVIPVSGKSELKLRLKFIPDNFIIDYAGIEFTNEDGEKLTTEVLVPAELKKNNVNASDAQYTILENSDLNYLITNPGDSYSLIYKIDKRYDLQQSLLISSDGYYNEWLRGSWIKNDSTKQSFDIYNIKKNLRMLAESWESGRVLIESEFFKSRIPVKED